MLLRELLRFGRRRPSQVEGCINGDQITSFCIVIIHATALTTTFDARSYLSL